MPLVVNVALWNTRNDDADPILSGDCIAEITDRHWNSKHGYYELHIVLSEKQDIHLRFRLADLIAEITDGKD